MVEQGAMRMQLGDELMKQGLRIAINMRGGGGRCWRQRPRRVRRICRVVIERCGVVMENASKMKQRDKRGGRKGVKREM